MQLWTIIIRLFDKGEKEKLNKGITELDSSA